MYLPILLFFILFYLLGIYICHEAQEVFFLKRKRFILEKLNMARITHGLTPLTMKESNWDDRVKSSLMEQVKFNKMTRRQKLKSWFGYLEVKKQEELFLRQIEVIK